MNEACIHGTFVDIQYILCKEALCEFYMSFKYAFSLYWPAYSYT